MKKHQREKLKQDGKWNQQMKCGPQSSMSLLDDYHSGEHPCHLTSTVAPESPQPPGALGWVGQAYAKRKSVRLQEVPPNRLRSVQMGGPVGTREGVYVSKIRERLRKSLGLEGAPQKLGDPDQLLGESKQVIWGLNLHSATWSDSITPPQPLPGWR